MKIELTNKLTSGELLKSIPAGWDKGDNDEFGIATAEAKDSDGDIIRVNGITLQRHKTYPVKVFGKAHNYSGLPDGMPSVVGVVRDFIKTQLSVSGTMLPCLAFKMGYATDDKGELTNYASKMKGLVRGGVLDAFSIGIDPSTVKGKSLRGGRYDIEECDLLEISLTPIPTNPYATILKSLKDGLGEDFGPFEYLEAQLIALKKSVDVSFPDRLFKRLDDIESAIVACSEAPAGRTATEIPPQTDALEALQKSLDELRSQL